MYSEEELSAKAKVVLRDLDSNGFDSKRLIQTLANYFRMPYTDVIRRIQELAK